MTNNIFMLNRKETFSASIVLFIGLFYLLSLASTLFQSQGFPDTRPLGRAELKWFIAGVVYVSGSIAMFRKKSAGWVIAAATVLLYLMLIFLIVFRTVKAGEFNRYHIFPVLFFFLLLLALTFLFTKETRLHFGVNNKSYLLTIGLYLILVFVTYVL